MSESDLYISNGECFYGEGQISDPRFIPCGNAAVAGAQACCFQGDFCLSTNVCYDNDTSVTYITGCTDPTYSSSKCPHKAGYPDQQWVALARCDGDDIDLFSGCSHHKNETVIKHEDCTCDAASALISNPAHGQPTLNQIALLPTTAGGTISFNPTALPTLPASSSHHESGGLSTSAKYGIGIGLGVGLGIPLVVAIFFLISRRNKKIEQQQQQQQQQQVQRSPSELPPGEPHDSAMKMQQGSPPPVYSPESQNAQYGWLRPKPELHAESAHKHELSAEAYNNRSLSHDGDGVYRSGSIQNTPFENYPGPHSEIVSDGAESHRGSGTPSLPFISPQSTGNTDRPQPGGAAAGGGHARTGSNNMDAISESHFYRDRYHS